MKKLISFLVLIATVAMWGQNSLDNNSKIYVSKKGLYQIKYGEKWHEEMNRTKWDVEFGDRYNLISAYFIEYDYFISEKHLKSQINAQFLEYGKTKKFKTYKKKINNLEVNYFEFELNYSGNTCKYQGFLYNGKGGSIELLFGGQAESMEKNQDSIEEFCNGISVTN